MGNAQNGLVGIQNLLDTAQENLVNSIEEAEHTRRLSQVPINLTDSTKQLADANGTLEYIQIELE